ncbi:uncharacterized protein TNCV_1613201 [Trichonephila clavipes]|nr:uncharacterized protein TNCV_1613201 [Trichonephila clavipes]
MGERRHFEQCRELERLNAAKRINDGASTTAAGAVEIMRVDDEIASILTPDCLSFDCVRSSFMKAHWTAGSARFTTSFVNNPFGHKCEVCDRQWFFRSLKPTNEKITYHCIIILSPFHIKVPPVVNLQTIITFVDGIISLKQFNVFVKGKVRDDQGLA